MYARHRERFAPGNFLLFLVALLGFTYANVTAGQDAELNPVEVSGVFSLNGEALRRVTILATGVGGGSASTSAVPGPSDNTYIDYNIIVNVPAGGSKDYDLQACLVYIESSSNDNMCFDKERITVTDGVPATLDLHYNPAFIQGTISVVGDTLSYVNFTGSYYDPTDSYLLYPGGSNRHFRAYFGLNPSVESTDYRVVVPHGHGEVSLIANLATSGAKPSARTEFDLAEGEVLEWNVEVAPPPGYIFGDITSSGPATIIGHNLSARNTEDNASVSVTENGPYRIDYLPDGTYDVFASTFFEGGAQYFYSSGQHSPSRSATITDGGSAEVNVSGVQALLSGTITLTESASNEDLSYLSPYFYGSSEELFGAQVFDTQIPLPEATFDMVAAPGVFRLSFIQMNLQRDGSEPDNQFSENLYINYPDIPELNVTTSSDSAANFDMELPLGKATVRLTVAGGDTLTHPRLSLNCRIIDEENNWLGTYSGSSRNPNQTSATDIGIVSFLAPESSCWVDAQARVGGSTTSFGRIEGIEIEPGSDVIIENQGPKATISFPSPGEVVDVSPIIVEGLAWDDGEVASVSVNGIAATLGDPDADDKIPFSVSVPLETGENLIELLVLDDTDKQFQSSRTVIYEGSAVDTNPPVVTAPDDVTALATGDLTEVDLGTATATDPEDGDLEATPDNPGPFPLGETLVTWSATDAAGNTGTDEQMVTVIEPYPFVGFLRPIANPPDVNRVKAGQAIPVKFQIPETDGFERDLDTVTDLSLTEINCEDMTEATPAESLDLDARPGLQFDDSSGEYHYRWKSGRNLSGCYRLTLTLDDGSMHHAYFRFR